MIIHTIDVSFILLYSYWILLHWRSRRGRQICKPLLVFICPKEAEIWPDEVYLCVLFVLGFVGFFQVEKLSTWVTFWRWQFRFHFGNCNAELCVQYICRTSRNFPMDVTNYTNNSPPRASRSQKFIVLCHWDTRINSEFAWPLFFHFKSLIIFSTACRCI